MKPERIKNSKEILTIHVLTNGVQGQIELDHKSTLYHEQLGALVLAKHQLENMIANYLTDHTLYNQEKSN